MQVHSQNDNQDLSLSQEDDSVELKLDPDRSQELAYPLRRVSSLDQVRPTKKEAQSMIIEEEKKGSDVERVKCCPNSLDKLLKEGTLRNSHKMSDLKCEEVCKIGSIGSSVALSDHS